MFKRLSLVVASWLLVLMVSAPAIAAGSVNYTVDSTYELTEDGVEVSHVISLSSSESLGEQALSLPGTTDSFDVGGSNAKVSLKPIKADANGISYKATSLNLDLGSAQTANLTINYLADDLRADYAKSESLFVPPLDLDGKISKQSVKVIAPLDSAIGNVIGLKPNDVSTAGGKQTYTFAQSDKITDPIVLQLGSLAVAEVEIKANVQNDSFWWKTVNVILPIDTNQQKSYVDSIEPKPKSVNIDQDGNIVASYNLRPRQQFEVVAKASVQLEQKAYDLESDGGIEQLDPDILADYTKPTSLWPEAALKDLDLSANELRTKTVIEATEQVHNQLVEQKGPLKEQKDFNNRIGKSERSLNTSLDYADRLVAALRGAGIPARLVGGVVTDNQLTKLEQSELHAWVEVYVPNEGWMTVDPSLGKLSKNFFGQAGLQRIALFIWGVNDHIPEFTDQSVAVNYVDKNLPDQKYTEQILDGNNFILLPGVSLLAVNVNMPSGYIQDEVTVQADGQQTDLGSLAPLQTARSLKLILGDKSWQDIPLQLQIAGETKTQASANLNLLGAVAVVALILILLWLMIKWYKKSKAPMVLDQDTSQADGPIEEEDLLGANPQPPNQQPQPTEVNRPYRLHVRDADQPSAAPAQPDSKPPTRINF